MGAGNYVFQPPCGNSSYVSMVYVDLDPAIWDDELQRRRIEFKQYLATTPQWRAQIAAFLDPDEQECMEAKLFEQWHEKEYCVTDEASFQQQQRQDIEEQILDSLMSQFPEADFYGIDDQVCIGDAVIVGTYQRMVFAKAYTYYGERLALIVTPQQTWQDHIWRVENDCFEFASHQNGYRSSEILRTNAQLIGVRRSINSGALCREMDKVFSRVLQGLDEDGLASQMSFRQCGYTSIPYESPAKLKAA